MKHKFLGVFDKNWLKPKNNEEETLLLFGNLKKKLAKLTCVIFSCNVQ